MRLSLSSLTEQVRLRLSRSATPSPAALRQFLCQIARACDAHDAALVLSAQKGLTSTLLLHVKGPARFIPPPQRSSLLPRTSTTQGDCRDNFCFVPFPAPFRGGLTLLLRHPDHARYTKLSALAELLACPAHSAALRQLSIRKAQTERILERLHKTLTSSATPEGVLTASGQLLLQHRSILCTIIRPVQAGTILLPALPASNGRDSDLLRLCYELEPDLAQAAATRMRSLSRRLAPTHHKGHPPARRTMLYTLPLSFAGQCFGTLTLAVDISGTPIDRQQKAFFATVATLLGQVLAQMATTAARATLETDLERKIRELSTLFRISRALHGIPRVNELMHFVLAAATSHHGGDFDRAMLFLANEQTDILQGILGMTRESAQLTFLAAGAAQTWENADLSYDTQRLQRQTPFCREVLRQRLAFSDPSPVARAFTRRRIIFVPHPEHETPAGIAFAAALELGPYVCVPLISGKRVLGILVVDNPLSRQIIDAAQLGFLELFASLAGTALGNAMLVKQLENASQNLHETKDRLLHGERLAILGEMAASVAHELKTPLISIGGFARRLSRAPTGARSAEYAGIIAREAARMEELLADILTFAKKQYLCYAPWDVGASIEQALQLERLPLAQAGIAVTCDIDPQLPNIQADSAKLKQVLLNLISNARQAMPQGGTLEISAVPSRCRGQDVIEIAVSDTGPGIPAEILPQLFIPFFSTKESGTGLGLPISAQIVQQHHGEIEALNRRRGATFLIRLPLSAPPGQPFR
jgi:hypothetical protein